MKNGFETFYLSKVNNQISQNINESPSSPNYYQAVYKAIKNARSISKPEIIYEIADAILANKNIEPPIISEIKGKLDAITNTGIKK
jgi:hypothetical protein